MRRLHILLVDGDPNACIRMQHSLGNEFLLQQVVSLSQARRFLAEALPDILICEVMFGNESGLDLCRFVRRSPELCHLPIILLTNLSTIQDKVAGFDAGADDYIVKPFDARHLAARIRLLWRIKRLQQFDSI
ncbi:MAG TPA: response regulator [Ktedonobacteraceae bacterium]|nr:response regulator [Ktedonobacteraceae bacterium]